MARRSTWREGTAGRELVVPVRRNWVVLVVVPVWLTLWISGIVGAAGQLTSGRARGGEAGFFEVWLAVAVVAGATVVYGWLWNAIGREVVGLRPGLLVIRRDVAGLGFSREYSLADVRRLRVSLPPSDASRGVRPHPPRARARCPRVRPRRTDGAVRGRPRRGGGVARPRGTGRAGRDPAPGGLTTGLAGCGKRVTRARS